MKYKVKFRCEQLWQTCNECSRQILITNKWHCLVDFGAFPFSAFLWHLAMCNWHLHFCPVPVNLLSTFSTGSSRNIVIFNCKLDSRWMPNSSWSHIKMCLKYLNHFSKTTRLSHSLFLCPTYMIRLPKPNGKTLIWWYCSHSSALLHPFHLLWSRKTWLFGTFFYHHQLFSHEMVWRSITQQHLSFLLT